MLSPCGARTRAGGSCLTGALVERLRAGALDLLLVALEAPLEGLATRPLFADPFVVALPGAHPLAKRKTLRESDLAGETTLLLEDGHCLREQALAVCRASGAHELGDFRASSLATLVEMVRGGAGVTLLPSLAAAALGAPRGLAIVPFAKPAPARTIGLAWRPRSGRAAEFEQLAESFA